MWFVFYLAVVVQKREVDRAIPRVNLYPVDTAIGFPNTYPLDHRFIQPLALSTF